MLNKTYAVNRTRSRSLLSRIIRKLFKPVSISMIIRDRPYILGETMGLAVLEAGGLSGDLKLLGDEIAALWKLDIGMIFLKQIRDVKNPTRAAFQSIVETECRMTKFHGATVYNDDFTVEIGDFDSHPIRSDMGFGPGTLKPIAGFWCGFDFWIGPGENIWTAAS